ncbi:hypothetical protein C8J57DRAFT_1591521 [Mycena rebaudengoi]|nr:hypothetical protein C8J57DRAFT_1591521 [Mycena rebaudengoi]
MSNNSQSHSSQSSSRDCTPDPNHDYTATQKELILLCTPSKSGNELAQLRSRLAASVDDHGRVVTRLKRRLDDLENQSNNPRKRGRRARNHRAKDDDIPSERRVRQTGRKFVLICGLWLRLDDDDAESFLKAALDDDYDPELRFNSDDDIRQGQLRELLDILPNDLETFRSREWFASAFMDGMDSQRSNTVTRLRKQALTQLLRDSINPSKLATSESRLLHFRHLIGYSEEEKDYLLWDIPFLHANESPTLDFHELFRHPLLLKVFAALIRGPSGADGVMEGESKMPKANTMQKMLKIAYTTPGAIASSAIWVLWLFSGDETFAPVGDITAIDYQLRHDEYLDKILEGLRLKKRWAKELFVYWDSRLFPSMNGSRFGGGVQSKHEKQREQMERATDLLLEMTDASEDDEDGDGDDDGDDNQGGDNRGGYNQCEDSDE